MATQLNICRNLEILITKKSEEKCLKEEGKNVNLGRIYNCTSSIFFPWLPKKKGTGELMSRGFITAIKGFSIVTVVWAHMGVKLGVGGGIQFIAGIGVSLLLNVWAMVWKHLMKSTDRMDFEKKLLKAFRFGLWN